MDGVLFFVFLDFLLYFGLKRQIFIKYPFFCFTGEESMIFIWLPLLFAAFSFQVFAGDVIVTVDRFKHNNDAPVRFSICDSEECHTKRDKGYVDIDAELIERTDNFRKYRIKNVELGEYSLSAYHDLNNSGKLERSGILGIPQEPIGFSRLDVQKVRRHPKWDEVKFHVGDDNASVTVHLVDKFGL
ncbi:MAG: DUF2141 domain-containing protein [Candidatus Kuenenia stuttgartiensis]|nr:DUF2141 domain-containing protein [Candidatus Kuenenia stuttgartiensis]